MQNACKAEEDWKLPVTPQQQRSSTDRAAKARATDEITNGLALEGAAAVLCFQCAYLEGLQDCSMTVLRALSLLALHPWYFSINCTDVSKDMLNTLSDCSVGQSVSCYECVWQAILGALWLLR